ncbi:MAG: hypothetical protein ACLSA6_06265 [Holdemania massiliensis]
MKSKTVIITGGGKGIGFVSQRPLPEGADIVITGRQESALAQPKTGIGLRYSGRLCRWGSRSGRNCGEGCCQGD